jgi:TusA-related sulfurtransferase
METLDLRRIPCPKNTAKALIYLATVDAGQTVEFLLDDGEPVANVPPSLTLEGHVVLDLRRCPEGHWSLTVKVAA